MADQVDELVVGIAIEVPEPFGSHLRDRRASFGDSLASEVPSHVTLIPPTTIAADELDGVCAALESAAVTIPPFTMSLRGTGTFRPVSPVVFIQVSRGISYTEMLAQAVRSRVDAPAPEFPFHPHVTVAHHLDDEALDRAFAELEDFSADFRVEDFALYLHSPGAGWKTERHFCLGPSV